MNIIICLDLEMDVLLSSIFDPREGVCHAKQWFFVTSIGDITYRADLPDFLVSGINDFSIWKLIDQDAIIWAHSLNSLEEQSQFWSHFCCIVYHFSISFCYRILW